MLGEVFFFWYFIHLYGPPLRPLKYELVVLLELFDMLNMESGWEREDSSSERREIGRWLLMEERRTNGQGLIEIGQ